MSDIIQVQITTPNKDIARSISKLLIDQKLAACAQIIGPIESRYHWNGQIEADEEYLCLIKAPKGNFKAIEAGVVEAHPYGLPQIIAIDVENASAPYRNWVIDSTNT